MLRLYSIHNEIYTIKTGVETTGTVELIERQRAPGRTTSGFREGLGDLKISIILLII